MLLIRGRKGEDDEVSQNKPSEYLEKKLAVKLIAHLVKKNTFFIYMHTFKMST